MFSFFWKNIKLISNCSNSTSEIGGSCHSIFRKCFCFLSFCFVLRLLSLNDNFIDFESTSQSASRDNAQLRQLTVEGSWRSCTPAVFLELPWSSKASRFLLIVVTSGQLVVSNLTCHPNIPQFFPNVSCCSYMKQYPEKSVVSSRLTDLNDWNIWCTVVKGERSACWICVDEANRFLDQNLANVVILNLISAPQSWESLGSEVTSEWLHAGVHTRLKDPENHGYKNNNHEFLSSSDPIGRGFLLSSQIPLPV